MLLLCVRLRNVAGMLRLRVGLRLTVALISGCCLLVLFSGFILVLCGRLYCCYSVL